jgi:hypothetical protein
MRYIGFFYSKESIYYCVGESSEESFNILSFSQLRIPKALNVPDQLSFIRANIQSIFMEYNISGAYIKLIEPYNTAIARTVNQLRHYVEGVIQECISDSNLTVYGAGTLADMAKTIGWTVKDLRALIERSNPEHQKQFGDLTKDKLTAMMAAYTAGSLEAANV